MDYWTYIDDSMELHNNVAPDGLPQTPDHAFVVLGYALNSDGSLRKEAKGRCDVAYESAMRYPNSLIFVTGGATASKNKTATEGGQMKDYLVKRGMDSDFIIEEDKSMTTWDNMEFSMKIARDRGYKIDVVVVITTVDHYLLSYNTVKICKEYINDDII